MLFGFCLHEVNQEYEFYKFREHLKFIKFPKCH